jgi:argininosuccinate lyase
MRVGRAALYTALAAALGACQTAGELMEGKKIDYKSAGQAPTLEIPPDLTTPTRDNRYVVPGGTSSATLSGYQADRAQQAKTGNAVSGVLPTIQNMQIERAGTQRWLVVPIPPEKVWPLVRDFDRLRDARQRIDVLPLGSGALAGTALPLDRDALARDLGFAAVSPNALDAVMDRDFAAELVFVCAQLQTHLARLCEDLIHFSGPEHGFLTLPEAFTSGSSLMPQKKNPDALELVRGKAARVDGDLLRLLALMKGLPAGYQKDLQEDKEAVFDAVDTAEGSVAVMTGVVEGLGLHPEAMARAAALPEMMAASLAVALAREGLTFRRAHGLVGALVAEAQAKGEPLPVVAARVLPAQAPGVAARLQAIFDPREAVKSKAAPGGTAPDAVRTALGAARQRVQGP